MAKAAATSSGSTTLRWGLVEAPIKLYSTVEKPGKLAEFETAGPNGGRLLVESRAVEVPAPELTDPLAAEAMTTIPQGTHKTAEFAVPAGPSVLGDYRTVLVEEGTGIEVDRDHVRRGVRRPDGSFVDCTEQLKQIEADTHLDVAQIISFVAVSQVARSRVIGAKYIGAAGAPKALRLLRDAMRITHRVAVVKLTKRTRQTLGVIGWAGDALMLYELSWAEDFRPPPAAAVDPLGRVQVSDAELENARDFVLAMAGSVNELDALRDDAIALREKLFTAALEGRVPQRVESAAPVPENSLAAQLAASLAAVA